LQARGPAEERLDRFAWLALFGSTVGAALITLGGSRGPAAHGESTLTGDLLIVASLFTALAWILLSKKLMETHSPPVVTAYTIFSGTIMLAVWVLGAVVLSPLTHAKVTPMPFAHVRPYRMDGAGHQRRAVHGHHYALVELGIHHVPASRAGVFLNIERRLAPFWASGCSANTLAPLRG